MSNTLPASVLSAPAGSQPEMQLQHLAIRRPNFRTEDLSQPQQIAMIQLAEGKSIVETARVAQVHRTTLHRWIRSDPRFKAAFNAWQDEVRTSARARLLTLCDTAIDTVQEALRNRDTKTAVIVLKSMGLLTKTEDAPTNADDIETEMKLGERQRKLDLEKAERQVEQREELASLEKLTAF